MGNLPPGEEHQSIQIVRIGDTAFCIALHYGLVRGRAEVVGLEIWSRPPFEGHERDEGVTRNLHPQGAPITSQILRDLNIGKMIQADREGATRLASIVAEGTEFSDDGRAVARETLARFNRPGRPLKYDAAHFAAVAQVYRTALADKRKPTAAIAKAWGISSSQAGRWVHLARTRFKLLPPTTPGRAAGGWGEG